MPLRAASPAASENEYDISGALFGADAGSSDEEAGLLAQPPPTANGGALDVLDDGYSTAGEDDEAFIARKQAVANRKGITSGGKRAKGGSFQAMGLDGKLLKAIARKGFSVPTPIQRKAIPMVLDGQDIVASARTGSGKTAAFVIPMIQQLKTHKTQVGARALILSPSRELALQTVKVANELGKGTDLRSMLVVGGDSMEDQFKAMTSNPDIIIATPGRFLHLQIEMGMDLSSFKYVVFDEADRLFEMGFAAQLSEILHALPSTRQTLLFSATLPKSLVEFVRAGLTEPKLVRLDAETKVSSELENAFFYVKSADKEGALLHILNDVIQMSAGTTEASRETKEQKTKGGSRKRKRGAENESSEKVAEKATIIFTATKHHVEFITSLLRASGFAVSYLYSSLDQTARKINIQAFRSGRTSILVVTDIAARGVDIPVLSNVINYDFASSAKLWIHRVGRTARAGRRGWSYNLITTKDLPYMLDLQLFLSKRLVLGRTSAPSGVSFAEDMVVGTLARDNLEGNIESVNKLLEDDEDLTALRGVASKGEKLYTKTRNSASSESVKRGKEILSESVGGINELNLLFDASSGSSLATTTHNNNAFVDRENLLARIRGFRPEETVFEVGKRGAAGNETADLVRRARERMEPRRQKHIARLENDRKQKLAITGSSSSTGGKIAERTASDAQVSASVSASLKAVERSDDFFGEDDDEGGDESLHVAEIHDGHADGGIGSRRANDEQGAAIIPREEYGSVLGARVAYGQMSDCTDDEGDDATTLVTRTSRVKDQGKGPGTAERGAGTRYEVAAGEDDAWSDEGDELEVTFSTGSKPPGRGIVSAGRSNADGDGWQDGEHFMSYTPRHTNLAEDRALSVHKGSGNAADFLLEARGATLDMGGDESKGFKEASRAGSGMRWDKKGKKYVSRANDLDGSREGKVKYIRGESGQKIASSFRSGRFEAWKKRERIERMPRVGEREAPSAAQNAPGRTRWKHKQERAPKEADKWRDDYHVRKKRVAEAREKRVGRFKEGKGKSELKSLDDVAKERRATERRREKNARPQRRGKK